MFKTTWTVIGAGPAGIASVGQLIDQGIDPQMICWIDPDFKVGDLGRLWWPVSSNTSVKLFKRFLTQCDAFAIDQSPHFELFDLDPQATCQLSYIVEPLQWITDYLLTKVQSFTAVANRVDQDGQNWSVELSSGAVIHSQKVILANGCQPKPPLFEAIPVVDLPTALNPYALSSVVNKQQTIAVFGSSHSAVLVLKTLVEAGIHRIINFYRSPLCYAYFYDDWILHDNTGLKGIAAQWAQHYLEDNCYPSNLERIEATTDNINAYLSYVDKAIYATGFERRKLPINGDCHIDYNAQTGEIAPNFYGVGIAFPEVATDRAGNVEERVGLWKFMEYIQVNVLKWVKSGETLSKPK